MRSFTIDVAIIGGGPGGTEAAQWAARKGLSVAVISNSPPGGRAFWSSLLPSKIWLHTAHRWEQIRHAPFDGITTPQLFNAGTMPERISRTSQQHSEQLRETLQQLGIQWANGTATLTAPGEISVEGENQAPLRIQARAVIIASGSLPRFTADIRPDMERIIAPRLMTRLRTLPQTLIMIGGGVTGTGICNGICRTGGERHGCYGPGATVAPAGSGGFARSGGLFPHSKGNTHPYQHPRQIREAEW